MAISGRSTQTQTETSSFSERSLFHIFKAQTSYTYLGVNCNPHQIPEEANRCHHHALPLSHPRSRCLCGKSLCTHMAAQGCGCCQENTLLITWFSGLHSWVQQDSSKKQPVTGYLYLHRAQYGGAGETPISVFSLKRVSLSIYYLRFYRLPMITIITLP